MKKILLYLVLSLFVSGFCFAQEMNLLWYKDNFYYWNYTVSDDGKYAVFTSSLTSTSRPIIYNMQTGKMVSHLQTGMPDFLGFLSNNEILLSYQSSTDSEKALIRYNVEDTNSFISYHHKDSIYFSRLSLPYHYHKNYWISPDKSKLYVIKDVHTTEIFDLKEMTLERTIKHENTYGNLEQLTISHDSKFIAYGFDDAIEIRDYTTGELKKVIKTPTWQFSVLLFSPDSKKILTNDLSNGLFFYDVASGDSIGFFPIEKMILYDYDIYPYTNKMLVDRNYILNFDSMKVDTLPITIFITDTTGPIKWKLVGFGSNNQLKVIDGKNYYYTSIIGVLNSTFGPQGYGLYLRDSTGKILKEYYNYQKYIGINKENNALIFEPWWYIYYFPAAHEHFRDYDLTTGDTIGRKDFPSYPGDVGYIGEYDQYYYLIYDTSGFSVQIYDYKTDSLVEQYNMNYKGSSGFKFKYGKKYAYFYTTDHKFHYLDWATKQEVDSMTIPETSKISLETQDSTLLIINKKTQDTTRKPFYRPPNYYLSFRPILFDKYMIVEYYYYQNNTGYIDKYVIFDLNTLDTIRQFYSNDKYGYLQDPYQIYKDNYLILPYKNLYWTIYDIKNNNVMGNIHYKNPNPYYWDTLKSYKFMEFTNDFRYALVDVTTYDPKSFSSSNKWAIFEQYYMFETNINLYDEVEIPQTQNNQISIYPNPASEAATIKFDLEQCSNVSLKLTDILGNQITLIDNQFMDSGSHSFEWDASGYPAGVYYYVLQAGGTLRTGKVVVVR